MEKLSFSSSEMLARTEFQALDKLTVEKIFQLWAFATPYKRITNPSAKAGSALH
jgi:hypothetical protein